MTELDVWTPQEIADEIGMSRQFIINVILGKTSRYVLDATKKGRTWLIANDEAQAFVVRFRDPQKEWYSPNDLAKALGKSRKYVLDALTGYGGRKTPRLAGEKRGDRWVIGKEEAERFIREHGESPH
jgi:biotin operon repressor